MEQFFPVRFGDFFSKRVVRARNSLPDDVVIGFKHYDNDFILLVKFKIDCEGHRINGVNEFTVHAFSAKKFFLFRFQIDLFLQEIFILNFF